MSDSDLHLVAPPTPREVELLRLLRGVRYGQIVVQVHDGRVAQLGCTERYRTDCFTNSGEGSRSA